MCQKTKVKDCLHCEESFEAKRKNHRYCSASCRVMACYKRKGYRYVSGHYHKPQVSTLGYAAADSLATSLIPAAPTPSQVPVPSDTQEHTPFQSQGVRGSGVLETVLGAGAVAAGKYLLHDRPLMEMVKELYEVLVAKPRRLMQQQQRNQNPMGMGIGFDQFPKLGEAPTKPTGTVSPAPTPKGSPPLTSHQLNMKKLGLDTKPFREKDDGMLLM
jgi:hypothetical protein